MNQTITEGMSSKLCTEVYISYKQNYETYYSCSVFMPHISIIPYVFVRPSSRTDSNNERNSTSRLGTLLLPYHLTSVYQPP